MNGSLPEPPGEEIESGISMSNYDHSIDPGLEEALADGKSFCRHYGWNFCGNVRWDGERYAEHVWVYGSLVDVVYGATLEELMTRVNDRYGWS